MNTVLDLIGEFGLLNDAKGIWGEKFPPESERRWRELKDFYDLLMSKSGIGPCPVTRRFTAKGRGKNNYQVFVVIHLLQG